MRPSTTPAWLAIGLLLPFLACTSAIKSTEGPPSVPAPAASRFEHCPENSFELPGPEGFTPRFTVIHINDTYRVGPVRSGTAGGLSRVAALIRRTRQETKRPVYVLHSGDFIFPSLESDVIGVESMVDALNFLDRIVKEGEPSTRGALFVVPGNHEFEKKDAAPLVKAINRSKFRWLGSNVKLQEGAAGVANTIEPDALVGMGGMKVGIFALSLAEELNKPYVATTEPAKYVPIAQERIDSLVARGAEAFIGLTHLEMAEDLELAKELKPANPQLLWIAGGHEHTCMYSPSPALVTKGDSNAVRIWRLDVGTDGHGKPAVRAEMIPVTSQYAEDSEYQKQVWEPTLSQLKAKKPDFDQTIGRTRVLLEAREQYIRNAETNSGNYLTDLMRTVRLKASPESARIGVLNGGLLRLDDTVEGELKSEHLERTLGFPAKICHMKMKGSNVRQMLEHSVSGNSGEGRFLQVSGLRFAFSRKQPSGQRVCWVEVSDGRGGFTKLDENATYVVAANDYIAEMRGDGYKEAFAGASVLGCEGELKALISEDLQRNAAQGIAPRTEGRITEVKNKEGAPEECSSLAGASAMPEAR